MRLYTRFPALIDEILQTMEDAVTLKPITDMMFDYGKTQF